MQVCLTRLLLDCFRLKTSLETKTNLEYYKLLTAMLLFVKQNIVLGKIEIKTHTLLCFPFGTKIANFLMAFHIK